jgi:hypothetical protein
MDSLEMNPKRRFAMAALHLGNEGYSSDGVNGKVGIGTNSPSEVLTVKDSTQLSIGDGKGNGGSTEIQIKNPAALLLGLDSETSGNEFLRFATDTRRNWIQSFEATAGNPQSAALTLAAGTTRGIEIDTNGLVGIGTASPGFPLTVVGNISTGWGYAAIQASSSDTEAGLSLNNTGTGGRQYVLFSTSNSSGLGGGKFAIGDTIAGAARLVIDSSGKVGIGSTAPSNKLTVATSDGSCDGVILTNPSGNMRCFLGRAGGGDGFLECYDDSNNRQIRLTSATDKSYINYGNVGIGETDPATKLQITESQTIDGALTDGYSAGLTLHPQYSASSPQTVTRHNYLDVNNPELTNVSITDAAVMRFDVAAGTHKALDSGNATTNIGTVGAWVKINIAGQIYYIPAYTGKNP